MTESAPTLDRLRAVAAAVPDPELPPLTLADLGILRSVELVDDTVVVTVTPTYSGCPAVTFIEDELRRSLAEAGCRKVRIDRVLSPAWTTEWITEEGIRKLTESGIAPPRTGGGSVPVTIGRPGTSPTPACPRCGSDDTELISPFGSTACKALLRCRTCSEPFDHFKEI